MLWLLYSEIIQFTLQNNEQKITNTPFIYQWSSKCKLLLKNKQPNRLFRLYSMLEIDILHMLFILFIQRNPNLSLSKQFVCTPMWTSVDDFAVLIIARQEHRIVVEVGRPLDIQPSRSWEEEVEEV